MHDLCVCVIPTAASVTGRVCVCVCYHAAASAGSRAAVSGGVEGEGVSTHHGTLTQATHQLPCLSCGELSW